MAELSFKQITDKLNAEFTGENRKLIFWYDAGAEFAEEIDTLELANAKILHLRLDNQFETKYFLERKDTSTNYLIYAPFAKPDIRDNHLADTILYSKEFFADRASLLCIDLGIKEQQRPVIQKHITFFNNKVRTQAFCDYEMDTYTTDGIENGMMSVLCKSAVPSFEEVIRIVLTDEDLDDNKYLAEFAKYDLVDVFWKHCETQFGYTDPAPTLEKLIMGLFITYTQKTVHTDLPAAWQPFVLYKSGSVIAFIDNLMNSLVYGEKFDELSSLMFGKLNAGSVLENMGAESIVDCCAFKKIDEIIIKWIIERLEQEDIEAKLNGKSIPEICSERQKKHFGKQYSYEYQALENAYSLILPDRYSPAGKVDQIAKNYTTKDCLTDRKYRLFYTAYDRIEREIDQYENLRQLVENIYTNDFLNNITVNWSKSFVSDEGHTRLTNQLDFYSKFIHSRKERIVVIISDAMRYEVGRSLFEMLEADEKCEVKISAMQSVLPSFTPYGMAALLPHRKVTIDENYTVLCDGMPTVSLKQREAILQSVNPNSICVQFDDIKSLKKDDIRAIFGGKEVIYVYHNQIDARGDKPQSENEVFVACEEAVKEIAALIRRITVNANTNHFIVTADHGFIYKRDKLQESDKISGVANAGKRYAILSEKKDIQGTVCVPMKLYCGDEQDERCVCVPVGSDLFKAPGSGLNYVHGGCSPQEMIIPVIEVRTEKSKVATVNASIALASMLNKITNLNISLEFLQSEAISDTIKETTYRIFFVDAAGNRISNENIYHADKKESEAAKRIYKLRFTFKNQTYEREKKYYLVAVDDKTNMETMRNEVMIDMAFAGDFGFGF